MLRLINFGICSSKLRTKSRYKYCPLPHYVVTSHSLSIECTIVVCLIQAINKDVRELKARVQTYLDEKEAMMGEHQELTKTKAKLELSIKDLQEELDGDSGAKVCFFSMRDLLKSCSLSFDFWIISSSEKAGC